MSIFLDIALTQENGSFSSCFPIIMGENQCLRTTGPPGSAPAPTMPICPPASPVARIATLTPRERQVFDLVIRGDTNKHIARALGCTERTIKAHRHRVMEKMQLQSLAELVSLAERVGVLVSAAGQTP
jgi:DNA-binding CsgD family transcriptional regulator